MVLSKEQAIIQAFLNPTGPLGASQNFSETDAYTTQRGSCVQLNYRGQEW